MQIAYEGTLCFKFPEGWEVKKYDSFAFYKNQFQTACGGRKAVDFIAVDGNKCVWFIEVKDYRNHAREKSINIIDEFCIKLLDSLTGVLAAKFNGVNDEQAFALSAVKARKLRAVLHFEQPQRHSRLFPRIFDPANMQTKIRQQIGKGVDPHALVAEQNRMGTLPWTVD